MSRYAESTSVSAGSLTLPKLTSRSRVRVRRARRPSRTEERTFVLLTRREARALAARLGEASEET